MPGSDGESSSMRTARSSRVAHAASAGVRSAIMTGLSVERFAMPYTSFSSFSRSSSARVAIWCMTWLLMAALGGCSLLPDVKDETANWSAERLYNEAHGELATGNYTRATKLFDTLETRFPYGRLA